MFLEYVVVIFYTLWLPKIPEIVSLRETPVYFCDGSCCCFTSLEVYPFCATFLCYQDSTLDSPAREGHLKLLDLPWLYWVLTFARFFLSIFYFTTSGTFFGVHFLPKNVFYIALLPTFWHILLPSHPWSFSKSPLIEFFLLASTWSWNNNVLVTRPWFYWLYYWATK